MSSRGSETSRLAAASGWFILVVVGGVCFLRALHLDRSALIVAAIGLRPWGLLLTWPVAALGVATRRKLLSGVGLIGVVASVLWVGPQFDPLHRSPAATPGGPQVRLLDANLTWTNDDLSGLVRAMNRSRPDIVCLEEITPADVAALGVLGVLTRFHWSLVLPSQSSDGMAVWSDLPLKASEWMAGSHPEISGVVTLPGGVRLNLLVVHTYIPTLSVPAWQGELASIARAGGALARPGVVVGDLNATWDMYEFQDILKSGLSDVAVDVGSGYKMTWTPAPWIPAVLRLDHVLVSAGVRPHGYAVVPLPGSQHRALEVDLSPPG